MADLKIPFSARRRGQHHNIDNDFPESARVGLLHLLYDLEERGYVSGWPAISRELQRIGRESPASYSSSSVTGLQQAKESTELALRCLEWDKLYDFCERLYGHLSQDALECVGFDEYKVSTPKSEVQVYISLNP